jgi:hypothetical protein
MKTNHSELDSANPKEEDRCQEGFDTVEIPKRFTLGPF